MNFIVRLVIASSLLLIVPHLSQAVEPKGQQKPTSVDTNGTVERGGTINAVNLGKKTMMVDGVSYPMSAIPVPIYDDSGKPLGKEFVLAAGMQIRFSTSKKNWAIRDEVREIWVTSIDGKPAK